MRQGIFLLLLFVLVFSMSGQNGVCCDPDGVNYPGPGACFGVGEGTGTYDDSDGVACDPDCDDYDVCDPAGECYNPSAPACNIPIDGGLSLLALAGGGLATAAMRRRREVEAAQEVV